MRVASWALAIAAAVAVAASGLPAARTTAAAGEPVPLADSYYLGGRAKLAVSRTFSVRPNVTWRIDVGEGTFTLNGLGETPLAGTFVRKGGTGKKLVLTFDPAALEALGVALGGVASANGENEPPPLSVTRSKALLIVGKTPEKSKLKLTLSVDAEVGADTRRGTFKLNGKSVARRVVVLDDGKSAPQVLEELRRRHIPAYNAGFYQDWDGVHPALTETDVVLFLQGYEYSDTMTPEADQALVAFVEAGGLLVRTEWCAYEYGDATGDLAIDAFLPVRAPERDYLEESVCSWTVQDRQHPLTKGLPAAFDIDGAGFSFVNAVEGATVLATNQRDEPALSIVSFGPGEVVHINHDLTYATPEIAPEILRVLVNCAEYGLRR